MKHGLDYKLSSGSILTFEWLLCLLTFSSLWKRNLYQSVCGNKESNLFHTEGGDVKKPISLTDVEKSKQRGGKNGTECDWGKVEQKKKRRGGGGKAFRPVNTTNRIIKDKIIKDKNYREDEGRNTVCRHCIMC